MQENSRLAVGLDIGTGSVRAVVGQFVDGKDEPTIIGVGEAVNDGGARGGIVVNLNQTAQAIDGALAALERMSGRQVDGASVSINGAHITSSLSRGRISISGGEVGEADLLRVEDDAAAVAGVDANHEILDIIPSAYVIDGNENVKDPIAMKGLRLEVDAHVVTALAPNIQNLQKALEVAHVGIHRIVPAGLAAARACLTRQQRENGVAMIDIGASTTSVVVYDEGDLIHYRVLPIGGNDLTKGLALELKTDYDVAERLKVDNAVAGPDYRKDGSEKISVKVDKQIHSFKTEDVDDIVQAWSSYVFDMVNDELRKIGKRANLPGGAVLAGGTANMRGIVEYAREALGLPARLAVFAAADGMTDAAKNPAYVAAIGLMLMDTSAETRSPKPPKSPSGLGTAGAKAGGLLSGLMKKFKS